MATVWLNDGEVNPTPGMFRAKELTGDQFFEMVRQADADQMLENKLRSWSNVYLVNARTKLQLKPDIEELQPKPSDTILAIFQRYPRRTTSELCYFEIRYSDE